MLSYPLINTNYPQFHADGIISSSGFNFDGLGLGSGGGGGSSDIGGIASSLVESIPIVGDLASGLLDLIGIDFNCINASFPPEKAEKETTQFINEQLRRHAIDTLLRDTTQSLSTIQNHVNEVLRIFAAGEYGRRLTAEGASGCTRDGEYVSSKLFQTAKENLLATIGLHFDISITNTIVRGKTGFRGALVRNNPTPVITIHSRKGQNTSQANNNNQSNNDSQNSGSGSGGSSDNSSNDNYKPTKDLIGWIALIAGLVIGLPALIYSALKKKK